MSEPYYTPDIKEFHVGFEFEFRNYHSDVSWTKKIVYEDDFEWEMAGYGYAGAYAPSDAFYNLTDKRVKYLDRADIESCGWVYYDVPNGKYLIDNYFKITITCSDSEKTKIEYRLRLWYVSRQVQIWSEDTNSVYLNAEIKNKSVLSQVMEMLKIELKVIISCNLIETDYIYNIGSIQDMGGYFLFDIHIFNVVKCIDICVPYFSTKRIGRLQAERSLSDVRQELIILLNESKADIPEIKFKIPEL